MSYKNRDGISESGVMWDDLRFPASAVNPPGAASDPDIDPTDGCWLFDPGSTELLFFQVQFPHKWKLESIVSPHVHWHKTTSATGNVAWRMRYQIAKLGDVYPGTWTDLGIKTTSIITDNDTAGEHLLTELGDIDMTGIDSVSAMMKVEIARIGGDGGDGYGADAKLLEFDIHYQIDSWGSRNEYIK